MKRLVAFTVTASIGLVFAVACSSNAGTDRGTPTPAGEAPPAVAQPSPVESEPEQAAPEPPVGPDGADREPPPEEEAAAASAAEPEAAEDDEQPVQAIDLETLRAIVEIREYALPAGTRPHDVAPARDGGVWYTAQGAAALGWLDPSNGDVRVIDLGAGSRPHGVIVGPDGAAWVTDGGLNAIVRVDAESDAVQVFPLPADRPNANLNTATFDGEGRLWFTGQNGVIGRLDPASGVMDVFDAPRGRGPYGIATTPGGDVYFASLAGSYVGRIDTDTGEVTVLEPPTPGQGARRVWTDSQGRIWVSEWNTGVLALFDPVTEQWREWPLPASNAQAYALYVDELDMVWLSDFGSNSIVRFDPESELFESFPLPSASGNVRQLLGRDGELWAPESGADRLVVIRYGAGE